MMKKILGIIPARYSSTRLPGKPLAMIGDKPMIQHVYENCKKALKTVYVATDDQRIMDAVLAFGGKVVKTAAYHRSGTERCAEAAVLIARLEKVDFDIVINIQGDEPFFHVEQLADLEKCFDSSDVEIATLVTEIVDNQQLFDKNQAKVVMDIQGNAIYFSRSPIPFLRNEPKEQWIQFHTFYRHMGIYAFRYDILRKLVKLPPSPLEMAESLEQLRWIENGYKVKCGITEIKETMGIDTPEDLEKANALYEKLKKQF